MIASRSCAGLYTAYKSAATPLPTPRTKYLIHNRRMKNVIDERTRLERARRLKEARIKAYGDNLSEMYRQVRLPVTQSAYTHHESGRRAYDYDLALAYADLFGVTAEHLYNGPDVTNGHGIQIPVVSMVTAGMLQFREGVEKKDVIRTVTLSGLPDGEWIGLIVDGDSMNRIAPPGSIIAVNRRDKTLLNDKFYVFVNSLSESTFKKFRKTPPRLTPYSTNPDHMSIPMSDDMQVFGRVKVVITEL